MPEDEALEAFDQYLDETTSKVEIAGVACDYSYVLKEMDPVAYDVAFADWGCENRVPGYF